MLLNIAHRGASGYEKENTMAAFIKAVELGADGIETDVQLSSDGELVLIHDETLDRTTNVAGFVKDYNAAQLYKMGIPALAELILLAKDHKLILNLELKNSIIPYEGMEEKLMDSIYNSGIAKQIILSSFNHYSMVKCKKLSHHIKTGLLYLEPLYRPERYCSYVGADGIHPYFKTLTKEIVNSAHRAGLTVNPYTVNEEEDMKKMIALGVNRIITNYPDRLKKLI